MAKTAPPADYAVAAQQLVQGFGTRPLAALMQIGESTLYNKANPNDLGAQLTGPEIIQITLLARDTQVIEAMCRAVHGAFYTLPTFTGIADEHLLEMFARMSRGESELQTAIVEAFADRKITRAEFERIERFGTDLHGIVAEIVARIGAMVSE